MEFLLPEEAAPITSRGNCTPSPSPTLTTSPLPTLSHEAPRTTPSSSSSSTLYLRHRLTPSLSSYTITDALHPRYRRGSIDASRRSSRDDLSKIGKLTIVDRHPFFLFPLPLIFFLLPRNKRKTRVCLFLRTIRSSAFRSP